MRAEPPEEAQCEAEIKRGQGQRCHRDSTHWTHEVLPGRRMRLCTQHYKMIEKRRERGSAAQILLAWAER